MQTRDLISTAGSQAATNEAGNKIVTVGRRTHLTWQDVTPEGYFNRLRTLDLDTGEWSPIHTLGSAYDDHARAVVVADSDGFLHAVLSGHNTPCTYRRSRAANDASAWTDPVEIADGTYPYLVCGPGDHLYLAMRHGKQDGVELYRKPPDGPWHHVFAVIDRPAEYTGYACFQPALCFDAAGVLHLVSDIYEGTDDQRGIHQAIVYLQSPDGGRSWRTWRGEPAPIPSRPCGMDVLCQSTGLRHEPIPPPALTAQGNIALDPQGTPHVLYVYHLNRGGELTLASPDESGIWRRRSIDAALRSAYPEHRPMFCRGTFTIDADAVFRALVTLVPADHSGWDGHLPTRPGLRGIAGGRVAARDPEADNPVAWLISRDRGATFTVREAFPAATEARSPKYELPVSGVPWPGCRGILYFDRTSHHLPGFPEDGGYQNRVYYHRDSPWT
jgi:hypothetical protein